MYGWPRIAMFAGRTLMIPVSRYEAEDVVHTQLKSSTAAPA